MIKQLQKSLNMQIVWFKRDLRLYDHTPLSFGCSNGPIIPLYIFEPELWKNPDLSLRHYEFLIECIKDLDDQLRKIGLNLVVKVGDAVEVFNNLKIKYSLSVINSHQETWNYWTYNRDKKVKKWANNNKVLFREFSQDGVIRSLKDRNGWSFKWYTKMKEKLIDPPNKITMIRENSNPLPLPKSIGLYKDNCIFRQSGGRKEGLKLLNSFLNLRVENYSKGISSPLSAFDSCSRLSSHLAFGTLSIREVFQKTERKILELDHSNLNNKNQWIRSLRSFSGRLRWHCHFIQKLEDEYRIEFENLHSSYDGLREDDFNFDHFNAWQNGETGFPMVDACMRSLIKTGYLNFRMRAMLVSFASYHLWLHWRKPALYLARLFTDYEPGIHYNQIQMQSGTTGINTIRIYNPTKQGLDHDPEGVFIKKWIPELNDIPNKYIHSPWDAPIKLKNYPKPIVEEQKARKFSADKIYGLRKDYGHRIIAKQIFEKHGSRKKLNFK